MPLGEPFDVNLVDHRLVQLSTKRTIALPVEGIVDDDGLRHVRRVVIVVALQIVSAERIGKHRRIPLDPSGDGARIGIDEQLGRVAAESVCRIPWTVHAKPVALARTDAAKVGVPAERRPLGKVDARFATVAIEQAQSTRSATSEKIEKLVPCRPTWRPAETARQVGRATSS